ncbi:MAG TPA: type I polyketide synthase, partial [Dongiaceae bacterium]|nr:type I polyketide synthase [Dongiaceae bacterium]
MASDVDATGLEIAVVGLAGRFPGAPDIDTFWRNIRDGVESVVRYSDDELRQRGVSETLLADATYVKAGVPFEGMDLFDAGFFGYTPRDAEQLDPQHRLFLECAWQALEHAGYDPTRHAGSIGVYAGAGASVYLMKHLLSHHALNADTGVADLLALLSGNMADALATRVAYKLNLRGPAVTVQTACSTSLMAVHTACQSLLSHECDMALAGGVSLNLLQNGGYRYQTGAIFSPDGHCRAFDAKAAGTLQGSGVGVVVLKRLEDALQDGDCIQAVIKASAANNDGSDKVGFTAPSIGGQAAVIRTAQVLAGVAADSIGYIEAHGTGTTLGDPIEIAALSQAFRAESQRNEFCAIGSVKTNVGHLDAAAGVTGFIKTVLALKHRTLPPSLHFEQPNPQIDFKRSPFYVNTEARPWQANGSRRRAGVSSFGIGGTNVHVVLEEAPESAVPKAIAADSIRGCEFLQLSARSAPALAHSIDQLELHLAQHPELDLAEVAHTLRVGRKRFDQRAVVLAGDRNDAVHALKTRNATTLISGKILSERPTVAFLFPGQGAQHPNMGRELYEKETAFREVLDRCCDYLKAGLGLDLRDLLFPAAANDAESAARLAQTELTQPALFAMEYALAHYWIAKGLKPDAMLGHSIGEYVAACLADVFTLEDALDLVVARGQLIQSTAPGAMLAVNLPAAELHTLKSGCDLAAVNADGLGVLSGDPAAIDAIERALIARDVPVRRLHVSHAFHSALLDPVLNDFRTLVSRVERRAPSIPFVSNLTGQWITAEEACSADYWVEHLRSTVRFADGLSTLLAKPDRILLEVGPGDTLSSLARRHPLAATQRPILTSQCHPREQASNSNQLERCLAGLWVAGIELDAMIAPAARVLRRVPLPTYPFERKSYWIAPAKPEQVDAKNAKAEIAQPEAVAHFYVPTWQRSNKHLANSERKEGVLLLLGNHDSFTHCLQQNLSNVGFTVASATQSAEFAMLSVDRYELRPACREDFERLIVAVEAQLGTVTAICHLWSLDTPADLALENGFYSLQALAQALGANRTATAKQKLSITVPANQVEDVTGIEPLCPEKATLIGLSKVIPQELPGVSCTLIDVIAPAAG